MPVDPAVAAMVGVVVGAVTSIATSRMAASANARLAQESYVAERADRIGETLAEAYVAAADAVRGLHPDTVEDSVLPAFEAEISPGVTRAIARLREAQSKMAMAAALSGRTQLADLALAAAIALNTLEYAWSECQSYARRMHDSEKRHEFFETQFSINYDLLTSARRELCGFGNEFRQDEAAAGFVSDESLLGRLRDATTGAPW